MQVEQKATHGLVMDKIIEYIITKYKSVHIWANLAVKRSACVDNYNQ